MGLWFANQQEDLDIVLLIGDAGPNSSKEIVYMKRQKSKIEREIDLDSAVFPKCYYKDEVDCLKNKLVPVHSFYLDPKAKNEFEFIANETGGNSFYFDIKNYEEGQINNPLKEVILRDISMLVGKGYEMISPGIGNEVVSPKKGDDVTTNQLPFCNIF